MKPTDLVILTVRVIVAPLGAAHFVPAADHGDTLGEHQGGEEIPLLPFAQGQDRWIIRGTLDTAVPAQVLICSVLIVLSVGFVVLLVVTDQIMQREAVMAANEVDARVGAAAAVLIQVATSRQAGRHFRNDSSFSLPETAYSFPILSVPLGPLHWKIADLIPALAEVPGFGNQLHL